MDDDTSMAELGPLYASRVTESCSSVDESVFLKR